MLNLVADFVRFTVSQYIWPFLGMVITFAIAVLVHEFGHFVVARFSGVAVDVFSIGFGKRLWGFKRRGTDYRISAFPLGGYVKIRGTFSKEVEAYLEGSEEKKEEAGTAVDAGQGRAEPPADEKPQGALLRDKPWIIRVATFAAGVAFNFLLAVTALAVVAWVGVQQSAPLPSVVGGVDAPSAIWEAGLREGDRIVEVNGRRVLTWERTIPNQPLGFIDLVARLAKDKSEQPLAVLVVRGTKGEETTHPLILPSAPAIRDACSSGIIEPMMSPAYIAGIQPYAPAHKAGIKRGDIVLAIDDRPIQSYKELREVVANAPDRPLSLRIRRGEEELTLVVTPMARSDEPTRGMIGVIGGNAERELFKEDFFGAWAVGFRKAVELTVDVAVGTAAVFARFRYSELKQNVAGPLGILGITFQRSREGWESFLFFMAFLNIALLIFNILPIPILDGGHILIATVESVTRRPLPGRFVAYIYYVFFALLVGLAIMVTWIDLVRFADWFGLKALFQ